jgi:hypothetical protein
MAEQIKPSPEQIKSPEKQERFLEGVVFEERPKDKFGNTVFVSDRIPSKRKFVRLVRESEIKPTLGKPYRVRIVEDLKPEDPMLGTYLVELALDQGEYNERSEPILKQIEELVAKGDFAGANKQADLLSSLYEIGKQEKSAKPENAPSDPEQLKAWRSGIDQELGQIRNKIK